MAATEALLAGIDLGAGSLKVSIVRADGALVAEASRPVATESPQPGWSEQDPQDWWRACCQALRAVLAQAACPARAIAAISFSAGAHTQVLEDAQGRVIRPAILWNDQRSRAQTQALRAQADAQIFAIAANRANPTWTLPQMLWLRDAEPESFARVARLYLAKDWLRARFTGTWETDSIDALGTLMLDAASVRWSQTLCDLIGWRMATLPPIVASKAVVGHVGAAAARATGLAEGTPVVCGSSDTAAETFGAGMVHEGMGVVKLATAATVSVLSPQPRPDWALINYYHIVPGHWYVITATNSCASAHKWLRDTFFRRAGDDGSAVFDAMDRQAAAVAAGAEGLFFHPYLNGERSPHWDPLLRADFVGAGFNHGAGHFVRALYEGIAYSLRDCRDVLQARGLGFAVARLTGGGARSALWRQIVADMLDVQVELPTVADASFGAALLAGVGVGVFASEQDAAKVVTVAARTRPDPARVALYERGAPIYRDIQAALAPLNHRIHDFVAGR
ncbi:xylulokinase [Verminephrobacter eiseniae]|uniref:xylulokinase n=1 Tax=Verminephrobacter eiseniae TaxID=364317 RepID=UPI0022374D3C|nr:xylulokinase [Verminephrobacter eiseniae]MCW5262818.1 xylulokinase [Verminephrobacter eiseniae]